MQTDEQDVSHTSSVRRLNRRRILAAFGLIEVAFSISASIYGFLTGELEPLTTLLFGTLLISGLLFVTLAWLYGREAEQKSE